MTRRNVHSQADSNRYYDWIYFAWEDLRCAEQLLNEPECVNGLAFHCQQSVEKALKSYILMKSDILVDGHNLPWLCRRAMRYSKEFAQWMGACTRLTKCYIETRYPPDLPLDIDTEQAHAYYGWAREIYLFICRELEQLEATRKGHPHQQGAHAFGQHLHGGTDAP
jgi:Uncharacterized conserved protein related to C-terminal domain of eukaryotic chaperone, SACSIN